MTNVRIQKVYEFADHRIDFTAIGLPPVERNPERNFVPYKIDRRIIRKVAFEIQEAFIDNPTGWVNFTLTSDCEVIHNYSNDDHCTYNDDYVCIMLIDMVLDDNDRVLDIDRLIKRLHEVERELERKAIRF